MPMQFTVIPALGWEIQKPGEVTVARSANMKLPLNLLGPPNTVAGTMVTSCRSHGTGAGMAFSQACRRLRYGLVSVVAVGRVAWAKMPAEAGAME